MWWGQFIWNLLTTESSIFFCSNYEEKWYVVCLFWTDDNHHTGFRSVAQSLSIQLPCPGERHFHGFLVSFRISCRGGRWSVSRKTLWNIYTSLFPIYGNSHLWLIVDGKHKQRIVVILESVFHTLNLFWLQLKSVSSSSLFQEILITADPKFF